MVRLHLLLLKSHKAKVAPNVVKEAKVKSGVGVLKMQARDQKEEVKIRNAQGVEHQTKVNQHKEAEVVRRRT